MLLKIRNYRKERNNGGILLNTSDKETEIILAQWKTCVEMADSVSRRRDTMNNIFITLNLAISATTSFTQIWLPLPVAGIMFCMLWGYLIHSYKQLNSAKFKVIHSIESKLPVQPFKDEWEKLLNKEQGKYKRLTNLELILPTGFCILYSGEVFWLIFV